MTDPIKLTLKLTSFGDLSPENDPVESYLLKLIPYRNRPLKLTPIVEHPLKLTHYGDRPLKLRTMGTDPLKLSPKKRPFLATDP